MYCTKYDDLDIIFIGDIEKKLLIRGDFMLFQKQELASLFDFDKNLPDHLANLDVLASEILSITQILQLYYNNNESISFHVKDNNHRTVFVDLYNVSEKTWYRNKNEIKEILYRGKVNDHYQTQFSINKALTVFGIEEPHEKVEYKKYLQLLYFFYIINYFAFPKKNIFKLLSKKHYNYLHSYDEGIENGQYLSFIMSNILTNKETLAYYIDKTQLISVLMNDLSLKINERVLDIDSNQLLIIKKQIESSSKKTQSVLNDLIAYCESFAMMSYCQGMYDNLTLDPEIFHFEPLKIAPFSIWKKEYILYENLDQFLYSNELYIFCKQIEGKVEVRDKLKFINSQAIVFLKQFLEYDRTWIKDFHEDSEGLVIQIHNGQMYIYALKIAVMIKTYNDLINKMKMRVLTGHNHALKTLRYILSTNWNYENTLPATFAVRFFLLAAHAQYLSAISKDNWYELFQNQILFPEIMFLKVMKEIYSFYNFDDIIRFLNQISF